MGRETWKGSRTSLAQDILEAAGKGKFDKVEELISDKQKPTFHPASIGDLYFGDYLTLFSESNPSFSDIQAMVGDDDALSTANLPQEFAKFGLGLVRGVNVRHC